MRKTGDSQNILNILIVVYLTAVLSYKVVTHIDLAYTQRAIMNSNEYALHMDRSTKAILTCHSCVSRVGWGLGDE